jgi:hypothetical protein
MSDQKQNEQLTPVHPDPKPGPIGPRQCVILLGLLAALKGVDPLIVTLLGAVLLPGSSFIGRR